ncbi:Fc receptor-like protein 5 isoform X1 [Tachysurus ichikawai]
MELWTLRMMILLISFIHVGQAQAENKPVLTVQPNAPQIFRGENVTLSCIISGEKPKPELTSNLKGAVLTGNSVILSCTLTPQSAGWKFYWIKPIQSSETETETHQYIISSVRVSDGGQYKCRAGRGNPVYYTHYSDELWVNVIESPKAVVTIKPDTHVFRGETVTLRCEIQGGGDTEWTYSWYKDDQIYPYHTTHEFNFSSVRNEDSGKYTCRGGRHSDYQSSKISDADTLTVSVSLIIRPSRTQHFTADSLSLSCVDQSNSTGWTVRRYTQSETSFDCSSVSGSTCIISFLSTSHTGVYWCQSESGGRSNPVNITVHDGAVILDSPVHPVTEGHHLTLRCLFRNKKIPGSGVDFYKDDSILHSQTTGEMTISSVSKSDEGFYHCKHPERGESLKSWVSVRGRSHVGASMSVLRLISSLVTVSVYLLLTIILAVKCFRAREKPKPEAVVTIKPDKHVFRGETVTLRCEIQGGGDTEWTYSWYKDDQIYQDHKTQEFNFSSVRNEDSGKYTCRGGRHSDYQSSKISDADTLTVSDVAETVMTVSPLIWLTEGDSVTLSCEVKNSSTGWTFNWYKDVLYTVRQGFFMYRTSLLSDSSRGSGGSYTLSPVSLNHTGEYRCGAERGVFYKEYSKTQPLWITGESPPVSLIIRPSRTQHFTADSLSLSCEDLSNSSGWTVRRYSDNEILFDCPLVSGSTCNISFLSTSYTGVYWCQSESGGCSNPVNITVHNGAVILDSPVHPVTEGHHLTLRCLFRNKKIPGSGVDFYKDDSILHSQTTGEMTISSVSKSDEGFYHCKHPERGESLKSWVSVRGRSHVGASMSVLRLISSLVTVSVYLLLTIILAVKCFRARVQTDEDTQNAVIEE